MTVDELAAQNAVCCQSGHNNKPCFRAQVTKLHEKRDKSLLVQAATARFDDLVCGRVRDAVALPVLGDHFLTNEVRPGAGIENCSQRRHDYSSNAYSGGDFVITRK
jgi:hypothetical protein